MTQQPISARDLVGRDVELASIREHLTTLHTGAGVTVLISGEAGIGKSRLIAEASRIFATQELASGTPGTSLRGHCFEPDRMLPYAPVLDLLRSRFARMSVEHIARDLGSDAPEFALLLPELARILPDLDQAPRLDPELEKRRVFQALLGFFARQAADGPVLLVIEDLHWCDDITLEFLPHLARQVTRLPVLLLLTYRSDEVNAELQHTLATLDRERIAVELPLHRLGRSEVDVLLRGIFNQPNPIRPDFLEAIHTLTDGNPFFIEEVVRGLVAQGDIFRSGERWGRKEIGQLRPPRSVQDSVQRRTARLSAAATETLRIAAVAGQFFDFDVLREITRVDESSLLSVMRELIDAQLVVEESAERFAFRHALTREAVYAGLLARERRLLHRQIGETIERIYGTMLESRLADLAYHFDAAEDWEKTFAFANQAAQRDLRLYAPRTAVKHLSQALHAAKELGISPPPELYGQRGRSLAILGDFDGAKEDGEATLALARAHRDQQAEWRALIDLGNVWSGHDYSKAGQYFEAALRVANTSDDQLGIAHCLTQLGSWHLNDDRTTNARELLQQALRIFEATGDQHGIARTLDLLGMVEDVAGDVPRMRSYLEQALPLFRELDDRTGMASCLANLALHAGAHCFETVIVAPGLDPENVVREAEQAIQLAREAGWRSGEAYGLATLAMTLGAHGEFSRALVSSRNTLAIASEIEHREWSALAHFCLGHIYRDLLDTAQEREHFEHAVSLSAGTGSSLWVNITVGALAMSYLALGEIQQAESLLAGLPAALPMETIGQRRVWTSRAALALAQAQPHAALEIIDRLFATAANMTDYQDIPSLACLRGAALDALGRIAEAEALLRQAIEGAAVRQMRPTQWGAHHALGKLYQSTTRASDAEREFQTGWSIIEELAETLESEEQRAGFLSRAGRLFPIPRQPATKRGEGVLTPREREVAVLVTKGLSNREIAETLFVGERTVETHVSNALAKLGFTSRAQIAAWATETGLIRD